jgi:exonuclease III
MRIVSQNLYNGAQDTYSELQEFVTRQNADILCLQEANGWNDGTPSRIEDFSAKVGLPYTVFGDSNTRFKLATLSRLPILSSEVITDGFWHSAVRTTVGYKAGELDTGTFT